MLAGRTGLDRRVQPALGRPGQRHPEQARDKTPVEPVAGAFGSAAFLFDPARAPAFDVGRFEVFPGKRFFLLEQFNN